MHWLNSAMQYETRTKSLSCCISFHCIASTTYSALSSTTDDHTYMYTDQLARFALCTLHIIWFRQLIRLCKAVHRWDLVSGSALQEAAASSQKVQLPLWCLQSDSATSMRTKLWASCASDWLIGHALPPNICTHGLFESLELLGKAQARAYRNWNHAMVSSCNMKNLSAPQSIYGALLHRYDDGAEGTHFKQLVHCIYSRGYSSSTDQSDMFPVAAASCL